MVQVTPKASKASKAKPKHAASRSSKQKEGRKKDKESVEDVQEEGSKQVGVKDPWPEPNQDNLSDSKESDEEVEVIEEPNQGRKKRTPRKPKARAEEPEKPEVQEEEAEDKEDEDLDFSDVEQDPVNGIGFVSNHWNGVYPEPISYVAKMFAKKTNTEQLQQVEELLNITDDEVPRIVIGELGSTLTPFLLTVPGVGRKVKAIYNLTKAANYEFLKGTEAESQLLALTGDVWPGMQLPSAIMIPKDCLKPKIVRVPEGPTFANKRLDPNNNKATWFSASKVERVCDIPSIMPVPAFLIYDMFDGEEDSMVLYERWMSMRCHLGQKFDIVNTALRAFLKAQVVTPTTKEPQTRLSKNIFIETPPPLVTHQWKCDKINALMDNLAQYMLPPPAREPEVAEPKATDIPVMQEAKQWNNDKPSTLEALPIRQTVEKPTPHAAKSFTVDNIAKSAATGAIHAYEECKSNKKESVGTPASKDKLVETFGMCKSEFEKLMTMCGLAPGEEDELPELWKLLAEEGLSKAGKKSIIKGQVKKVVHYEEEKLVLYAPLIAMIAKRDFEEETSLSSAKSAAKGLTPYAVPPLTDMEIDAINDQAEALEKATTKTVKDHTNTTMEAKSPKSFGQLVQLLKRFANLLIAIFGPSCPLYVEIVALLKHLEGYGDYAKGNMSLQTMASVTWLVHLQARNFASGIMTGGGEGILAEFSVMCGCVQTKLPVVYGNTRPRWKRHQIMLTTAKGVMIAMDINKKQRSQKS